MSGEAAQTCLTIGFTFPLPSALPCRQEAPGRRETGGSWIESKRLCRGVWTCPCPLAYTRTPRDAPTRCLKQPERGRKEGVTHPCWSEWLNCLQTAVQQIRKWPQMSTQQEKRFVSAAVQLMVGRTGPPSSPQSRRGSMTWVVEQHDQIKGRVSVLSSEVDVSTLTQQVLDNVFIAGSRKQRNKDKNRLMIMSCFILLTVGPSLDLSYPW